MLRECSFWLVLEMTEDFVQIFPLIYAVQIFSFIFILTKNHSNFLKRMSRMSFDEIIKTLNFLFISKTPLFKLENKPPCFGGKLPQSNCFRNRIEELNSIYFCENKNEFPTTRHCLTQQGYFNVIFTWILIVCYFKSATIVATQCYQWNSRK